MFCLKALDILISRVPNSLAKIYSLFQFGANGSLLGAVLIDRTAERISVLVVRNFLHTLTLLVDKLRCLYAFMIYNQLNCFGPV